MGACDGCNDPYCGDCAAREVLESRFMGTLHTETNLDAVLKSFGVKYTFIESGRISVEEKLKDLYGDAPPDELKNSSSLQCWCELSWGSDEKDTFDYALIAFGDGPGKAITQCLEDFISNVKSGTDEVAVSIAKHYRIFDMLTK